jgi:2-oxoisovalerate dehydrogenase E1 component
MNAVIDRPGPLSPVERACLIRAVEERLLRLFAEGKVAGTTHTCIGQELSAVMLAASLDPSRDVIVSNHRCHGHYVAWTDDVEGLIAEVMGKKTGVCGGIGGSQHLCGRQFYSNGIQGGIVPVTTGMAFANKLGGGGGIAVVCIGDGTLGEGVVYESFNIAAKWGLPLLVVLENNRYAQSTSQSETLAGDICARAAAFGWRTYHADTWDFTTLEKVLGAAVAEVRSTQTPVMVRVDTYRLAAHSKSDDNRDPEEIAAHAARDPINYALAAGSLPVQAAYDAARQRVEMAVAAADSVAHEPLSAAAVPAATASQWRALEPVAGTQLDAINRALRDWLADDPRVLLMGEDIRAPYGGAFKVTRGLSDQFPDRIFNTPISEAAIVGVGNGLALSGWRPIVEIMFGDFLSLCFDQLVNHAAKFAGMYNDQVRAPIIVRTPMGGGRGYGPTHSQNLEKHFVGTPGLNVIVLHGRAAIGGMYSALRGFDGPMLIIENKLLYGARCDTPVPAHFRLEENAELFPTTRLYPKSLPDLTVVVFGRLSVVAEKVIANLYDNDEISIELIMPLRVSPFDPAPVLESVRQTGKLLVIEEGAEGFDLAAEVISTVCIAATGSRPLKVRRLAAKAVPIPSAMELERQVLPGETEITAACLELFDA